MGFIREDILKNREPRAENRDRFRLNLPAKARRQELGYLFLSLDTFSFCDSRI